MKKIKFLISIVLILLMFTTSSMAAETSDSFKIVLEVDNNKVTAGKTIEVKIVIDNIQVQSGEQGIAGYTAKLEYDSNVLTLEKVSASEGWEVMENEGKIVANTADAEVVKTKTETAIATFKVNDNTQLGNTQIKISDIEGTSIAETIKGAGSNCDLEIVKGEDPQEPGDNTDGDNTDGNNTNGDNNTSGDNSIDDGNQAGGNQISGGNQSKNQVQTGNENLVKGPNVLPKAGITKYISLVIVVLIITSIVLYMNYRKYRKI